MVRPLLAGVLFATVALAAPVPKDFLKPKPKLDGRWKVTSYETNGRPTTAVSILNQTWAFDGENLTITRATAPKGAAATKIKVRADVTTKPMAFDYILSAATTRLGVFAVDGDTLTVCLTINTSLGERPTDLDGGTGTLKYTFTRVKDK